MTQIGFFECWPTKKNLRDANRFLAIRVQHSGKDRPEACHYSARSGVSLDRSSEVRGGRRSSRTRSSRVQEDKNAVESDAAVSRGRCKAFLLLLSFRSFCLRAVNMIRSA